LKIKTKKFLNPFNSENGILSLALILLIVSLFEYAFLGESFARELLPLESSEYVRSGINVGPSGVSGQKLAIDLILRGLGYVKILTAVIGVLMITLQGVMLIKASGNSEELTKVKTSLTYIIIAFILISMGQDLAKIFDMSSGSLLSSPSEMIKHVQIFDKQVEVIITFIKYFIGAVATLNLVIAGINMGLQGSKEETVEKEKKKIYVSLAGLLIIIIGQTAIEKVFYVTDKQAYSGVTGVNPSMSISAGISQVVGITNFVISFMGVLCVLMLVYAAFLYALSGGNEEQTGKAKKILLTTFVGMLVVFGAFALVSTIISAKL
jgi:hypothetical protein